MIIRFEYDKVCRGDSRNILYYILHYKHELLCLNMSFFIL